jgi:hypothetical protein
MIGLRLDHANIIILYVVFIKFISHLKTIYYSLRPLRLSFFVFVYLKKNCLYEIKSGKNRF